MCHCMPAKFHKMYGHYKIVFFSYTYKRLQKTIKNEQYNKLDTFINFERTVIKDTIEINTYCAIIFFLS